MSKRQRPTWEKTGAAAKRSKTMAAARRKPIKRMSIALAPELKYNDVTFNTDATTTPTVVSLTNFAAGDTALLRDGNKILTKSLNFRMQVANEALTQSNTIRCVVVVDKQPNGTAPTYSGNVVTSVFDAQTITAQRQVSTQSRFHILKDEVFVLNQIGSTGGALSQAFWQAFVPIPAKYELAIFGDQNAGEPITNGLYFMYIGSTAAGVVDTDVVGTARLRFIG